jgi:hypothetical protein
MTLKKLGIPIRFQSGLVFLLMTFLIIIFVVSLGYLLGLGGRYATDAEFTPAEAKSILDEAKTRLLIHAAHETDALGRIWYLPDIASADETIPGYEGDKAQGGCVTPAWSPISPTDSWANMLRSETIPKDNDIGDVRCFGRYPWRSLGLGKMQADNSDVYGRVPWLHIATTLTLNNNCAPHRTPLILSVPKPNFKPHCTTLDALQPWLTVRDTYGGLLSDEVAFVLILPGRQLEGQNRNGVGNPTNVVGPTQYIDQFTVSSCPPSVSCTLGVKDNAAAFLAVNGDNPTYYLPLARIDYPGQSFSHFTNPDGVNDRLLFISAEDYYSYMEKQALKNLKKLLDRYFELFGYYPYAADINGGVKTANSAAVNGLHFGWVPYRELVETLSTAGTRHPPGWASTDGELFNLLADRLETAGWFQYFFYTVSALCTQSAPNCMVGDLTAGNATQIKALLIAPGKPLPGKQPIKAGNAGTFSDVLGDYLEGLNVTGNTTRVFESAGKLLTPAYNDKIWTLP